jgi:hypothetical protein
MLKFCNVTYYHASVFLHWYLQNRRTALYARYPAVDPQTKVTPGYRGQAAVRRPAHKKLILLTRLTRWICDQACFSHGWISLHSIQCCI